MFMISMVLFAMPTAANQQTMLTEDDNIINHVYKKIETFFYLQLKENPNKSYSWQLSLSKGLSLTMEKYYSPESSKRGDRIVIDAAGFHSCEIKQ